MCSFNECIGDCRFRSTKFIANRRLGFVLASDTVGNYPPLFPPSPLEAHLIRTRMWPVSCVRGLL